mgnify:CR=1 FL=1|jgi:hypothetical protein
MNTQHTSNRLPEKLPLLAKGRRAELQADHRRESKGAAVLRPLGSRKGAQLRPRWAPNPSGRRWGAKSRNAKCTTVHTGRSRKRKSDRRTG